MDGANIARWDRLTTGSSHSSRFPQSARLVRGRTTRAQRSSMVGGFLRFFNARDGRIFRPFDLQKFSDQMAIVRGRQASTFSMQFSAPRCPLHPLKHAGDSFIFNFDTFVTFMCDSRNQGLTILRFAALLLTRILNEEDEEVNSACDRDVSVALVGTCESSDRWNSSNFTHYAIDKRHAGAGKGKRFRRSNYHHRKPQYRRAIHEAAPQSRRQSVTWNVRGSLQRAHTTHVARSRLVDTIRQRRETNGCMVISKAVFVVEAVEHRKVAFRPRWTECR
jgi:hypothetical protein